jgi:hypothetical protein
LGFEFLFVRGGSMSNRDFKGVWIPKEIWLNENLTMLEKVIFVEIDSLDNEDHCIASNEYFANFCGCSESKVTKAITKLISLNMIEKVAFDGRHRKLRVVKNDSQTSKKYDADSQKMTTNNIYNNITNTNTLSKDNVSQPSESFDFGKPKKEKKTNSSEYDKAIDLVKIRYSNPKLVSVLTDYVTGKKEQAGKLRHRFSSVTIKTYLDELDEICESDSEKIEAVRLSINYNFTSKVMKPFTNSSGNSKSNIDRITNSTNGVNYYEDEDHTKSTEVF